MCCGFFESIPMLLFAVLNNVFNTFNKVITANATAIVVIHVDAITSYVGEYVYNSEVTVVVLFTIVVVVPKDSIAYPILAIPKLPHIRAVDIKKDKIELVYALFLFVSDKIKNSTDTIKKNNQT